MWPNPQQIADLVTFTVEILNGKLQFLCSDKEQTLMSITQTESFFSVVDPES